MQADLRETFHVGLYAIAKKCNYEMNDFELDVYEQELMPLGFERVIQAMREIYLDLRGGGRGMPSVNEIKERMGVKEFSVDQIANDAASRACGAVARFGYYNEKEAKAFIGSVGWEAIRQRFGNWSAFCEQLTYDNQMGLQAQLRETAKVIAEKMKRGMDLNTAALPEATTNEGQKMLSRALRIAATGSE